MAKSDENHECGCLNDDPLINDTNFGDLKLDDHRWLGKFGGIVLNMGDKNLSWMFMLNYDIDGKLMFILLSCGNWLDEMDMLWSWWINDQMVMLSLDEFWLNEIGDGKRWYVINLLTTRCLINLL